MSELKKIEAKVQKIIKVSSSIFCLLSPWRPTVVEGKDCERAGLISIENSAAEGLKSLPRPHCHRGQLPDRRYFGAITVGDRV